MKTYVLRFISGKYQGGEFPLQPGREIVVGRSSDLDMVLVEDMVSRKHAKISMQGDQILLQDLGSTNGTFVNGEKVKRTRLKDGDRVLIGTSIIKLVAVDAPEGTEEEARQALQDISSTRGSSQVRTMTGTIDEIPLPDLLQLFTTSKKSGVLMIRAPSDVGRIYLRKGQIRYATINDGRDIAPLKCVHRMLRWDHGSFELEGPDERDFGEEIDHPTEMILMEGLRQLDEIRHLQKDLPAESANVSLAMPLIPPLRDLSGDEAEILQLAYNYGHVGTVLNKASLADIDTWKILLKLLRANYLRTT